MSRPNDSTDLHKPDTESLRGNQSASAVPVTNNKNNGVSVGDLTLNEQLAAKGYTTKRAPGMYKKHILKGDEIVFTGNAGEVQGWLLSERVSHE